MKKDYGKDGRRGFSKKWRAKAIELIKAGLKPETRAKLLEMDEMEQMRHLNKFIPLYQQKAINALVFEKDQKAFQEE